MEKAIADGAAAGHLLNQRSGYADVTDGDDRIDRAGG